MAKNKNKYSSKTVTAAPAAENKAQVAVSNDPVVSEEMVERFAGLPKDMIKIGIITIVLLAVLTVLWFIFR